MMKTLRNLLTPTAAGKRVRKYGLAAVALVAALVLGFLAPLGSAAGTQSPATSTAQPGKIGAPDVSAQACSQPGGSRPTLRLGSSGSWVTYLQCLLNQNTAYDFFVSQDGGFGYRTLAGVLWLQVCEEVVLGSFGVDGEVGPNTWGKAQSPDSFCHL